MPLFAFSAVFALPQLRTVSSVPVRRAAFARLPFSYLRCATRSSPVARHARARRRALPRAARSARAPAAPPLSCLPAPAYRFAVRTARRAPALRARYRACSCSARAAMQRFFALHSVATAAFALLPPPPFLCVPFSACLPHYWFVAPRMRCCILGPRLCAVCVVLPYHWRAARAARCFADTCTHNLRAFPSCAAARHWFARRATTARATTRARAYMPRLGARAHRRRAFGSPRHRAP